MSQHELQGEKYKVPRLDDAVDPHFSPQGEAAQLEVLRTSFGSSVRVLDLNLTIAQLKLDPDAVIEICL